MKVPSQAESSWGISIFKLTPRWNLAQNIHFFCFYLFLNHKISDFKMKKYYLLQLQVKIERGSFLKVEKIQFFNFWSEIQFSSWREKATSRAEPSSKSFSLSYDLSQLVSNSSLLARRFVIIHLLVLHILTYLVFTTHVTTQGVHSQLRCLISGLLYYLIKVYNKIKSKSNMYDFG